MNSDPCHILVIMTSLYEIYAKEAQSTFFVDMRLKFLSILMLFVMSITMTVTIGRFGFGVLEGMCIKLQCQGKDHSS